MHTCTHGNVHPSIRITDLTFITHRAFYTDCRARLSIVRPRLAPLATPRLALAPYHPQDTPCPDSRTAWPISQVVTLYRATSYLSMGN